MTEPVVGSEAGAATVAGVLRARAAERPDQVAFTFLADGEAEGGRLTYGELDRRAAAIAVALAAAVRPGDRALLLYPPGLDFVAAFFGCLYAGVVAVPAYPPRPNDRSQSRLLVAADTADLVYVSDTRRNEIIDAIKTTLDRTPPELAADIMDRGIVLAGGGALLNGLDERLRHETQMPVHLAESPLTCVAVGSGRSLEEFEAIHRSQAQKRRNNHRP